MPNLRCVVPKLTCGTPFMLQRSCGIAHEVLHEIGSIKNEGQKDLQSLGPCRTPEALHASVEACIKLMNLGTHKDPT